MRKYTPNEDITKKVGLNIDLEKLRSYTHCDVCKVAYIFCELLPDDDVKKLCKELIDKIDRGEIDGKTAQNVLLRQFNISKEEIDKLVSKAIEKYKELVNLGLL